MYRTFIETNFSAAHQLHGYKGQCGRLHGHTWKIRVEVETDVIDEIGIGIDFKLLKANTHSVIEKLDHEHINEIPPFDQENPTAENLAKYIYRNVAKTLPEQVHMVQVIVWESEHYAVSYME